MTVKEALTLGTRRLRPVADVQARRETTLLVADLLGIDDKTLFLQQNMQLTARQEAQLLQNLTQREAGEPLQYILGEWAFMGLPFFVSKDVLIPRPDTEILCEQAIRFIKERGYQTALDLCCGSGCIGISVAKYTGIAVTSADISKDALAMTEKNAAYNSVDMDIRQGDLFDAVRGMSFDMILTNPPYLTADDMLHLQKEVRQEPALALDGGADGLDFYRRIASAYGMYLNKGGVILLEIGATQARDVAALFCTERICYDYGGNARVVVAEKE